MAKVLNWQCKLGHEWQATAADIKKGRWCPLCAAGWKSYADFINKDAKEKIPSIKTWDDNYHELKKIAEKYGGKKGGFSKPDLSELKEMCEGAGLEFSVKTFNNYLNFLKNKEKLESEVSTKLKINKVENLKSVIERGEGTKLEFKSTLRYNIRSKKYDNDMIFSVLKTINGMINTKGGILLIGVEYNGDIYGIKDDGFKNNDDYLRFLYQQIINSMDKDISSNIITEIIDVEHKSVCLVEIPTRKKVWLKWKEQGKIVEKFFIRTGPRTDELLPSEVDKYIQENN